MPSRRMPPLGRTSWGSIRWCRTGLDLRHHRFAHPGTARIRSFPRNYRAESRTGQRVAHSSSMRTPRRRRGHHPIAQHQAPSGRPRHPNRFHTLPSPIRQPEPPPPGHVSLPFEVHALPHISRGRDRQYTLTSAQRFHNTSPSLSAETSVAFPAGTSAAEPRTFQAADEIGEGSRSRNRVRSGSPVPPQRGPPNP
jgi:hypothetical protein